MTIAEMPWTGVLAAMGGDEWRARVLPGARVEARDSDLIDAVILTVTVGGVSAEIGINWTTMLWSRDPTALVARAMVSAHDLAGNTLAARSAAAIAHHHRPTGVP